MKKTILLWGLPVLLILALTHFLNSSTENVQSDDSVRAGTSSAKGEKRAKETGTGFAVVELFTSEGCSSCPPADALLNTLIEESDQSGKPVYALAFHVDYWNRLGWTDPFSDAEYSNRQRLYAETMKKPSVYTPQMVVNGTAEFVGSDERQARKQICEALAGTDNLIMNLRANLTDQEVAVRYDLEGASKNLLLNIALVEKNLVTDVPRGENSGRTLHHDNVVRAFKSVPVAQRETSGMAELLLPAGIDRDQAAVIAYLQEPGTLLVRGAASSTINK